MGTECLYLSQAELAAQVAASIASVGFKNRGAKKRTDLYFLNQNRHAGDPRSKCVSSTARLMPTSTTNASSGFAIRSHPPSRARKPTSRPQRRSAGEPAEVHLDVRGKVSHFGGPEDTGVSASEGLPSYTTPKTAPWLFLPEQPPGTTGLARRLDPNVPYIAMRWDYDVYSKAQLASMNLVALVYAPKTERAFMAWPADWGPAGPESDHDTGRIADISPGLMKALGIQTDDEVQIVFPVTRQEGIAWVS